MEIIATQHFKQRIKERYEREEQYILKSFAHAIKMCKRGKIYPQKGKEENTLVIRFNDMKFVYSKREGKYYLITFGKRNLLFINL